MAIRPRYGSRPARGFTLVELMVALAIGLLMSFGLIRVFASSSDSYRALALASQQIENGRYAIQVISEDLRHAGFYGEYAFVPAAGAALPDPCEIASTVNLRAALPFYVQAYNDVGASPIGCLDTANIQPGTDILVVRRANTLVTAFAALEANDVYLQGTADSSDAANPVMAFGSQTADFALTQKDAVTLADIRKFRVLIYFVSPCGQPVGGDAAPCTAAADGGRPIPTLKRLSLGVNSAGNRLMRIESLAEGIEDLQIDFGLDVTGDGLPDAAFVDAAAIAAPSWSDVMAAQLFVLARTQDPTDQVIDAKSYNMGTAGAKTPGGAFRRHLFTSQVRLVNPAGRREVP